MLALTIILLVLLGVVVLAGLVLLGIYNGLVRSRVRAREAWSGIDVQLKRRARLIPHLVGTVKVYAAHEKQGVENVARDRALRETGGARPCRSTRTPSGKRWAIAGGASAPSWAAVRRRPPRGAAT